MKFEYLIFNLVILAFPILSFVLYKKSKPLVFFPVLFSLLITAMVFIIGDQIVTNHFWKFNSKFTLGINFFKIPIEEVLFFFSVPASCLFLWENFSNLFKNNQKKLLFLNFFSFLLCVIGSIVFAEKNLAYTSSAFFGLGVKIIFDQVFQTKLFSKPEFFAFLGITLIFTLIFNFYLTARPVVIYNPDAKTNLNILTIPFEDFLYGLNLISFAIMLYETFKQLFKTKLSPKNSLEN